MELTIGEYEKLGQKFKVLDDRERPIEKIEDQEIIDGLTSIYRAKKDIEIFEKFLKSLYLERELGTVLDATTEIKIMERDGNSKTIIDVKKVYNTLSLEEFLNLVSITKSNAKTLAQQKAILDASTIEKSKNKIVEVTRFSEEDKKLLNG